jgi:hypothetical protein
LTTIEGGNLAGINNEVQWSRPLFRGNLLNPENGSASTELFQAASNCRPDVPVRCLVDILGQEKTLTLINQALRETIRSNPIGYGLGVARHFSDFLSFSGQQYISSSPAQVQCVDISQRAERGFQSALEGEWLASDTSGIDLTLFRGTVYRINGLMCPPWFESEFARSIVDNISSLYSVFAPSRAYILYGLLFVIAISWQPSRQYLQMILASMLIIFYHAGVSSLIFNVQARYAVVINTYRIILLVAFIYLAGRFVLQLLKSYTRRSLD